MIPEELSDKEIERLVRLYSGAEKDILALMNKGFMKNDPQYMRQVLERVRQIVAKLTSKAYEWTERSLADVYDEAVNSATAMIGEKPAIAVAGFGAVHEQSVKVLADNTKMRLADVGTVIGRRVEGIYRDYALEAVRGSVVGYQTWQQSARKYRDQLADQGITGFTDKNGRPWNMTTYAEMVARTTTMEAHLQGTTNRLLELGQDLVKVSTHNGACPKCQPWQGKILSLTGQSNGYKTLEEAKASGLFHPNCRHAYGLFVEANEEQEVRKGNWGDREYTPLLKAVDRRMASLMKEFPVSQDVLFEHGDWLTVARSSWDEAFAKHVERELKENPKMKRSTAEKRVRNFMNDRPEKQQEGRGGEYFGLGRIGLNVEIHDNESFAEHARRYEESKRKYRLLNKERAEKGMAPRYQIGVSGGLEATAIHEYGHAVERMVRSKISVFGDLYRSHGEEAIKQQLGHYATTNVYEFFAECFLDAHLPNPSPIAVEFMKKLKEVL